MAFKIKPQKFRISRHDARTLAWWNARKSTIDMQPSYQRQSERWNLAKKQYLIDSILNGFDIPKIYLADFTWLNTSLNERASAYAVIDGKQRLESIFGFFEDKFGLGSEFVYKPLPTLAIGGLKYSEIRNLHPEISEIFDNYNLDVMSVVTSDPKIIDDLFYRLNSSAPLSGAEIRNSITGEVTSQIRDIASHNFFGEIATFNKSQGQHLNSAAKLILFELSGEPQETKKRNLDALARSSSYLSQTQLSKVMGTLDSMSKHFGKESSALKSEGQIPAYYWVFRNTQKKNHKALAELIIEFSNATKSGGGTKGTKSRLIADYKAASRSVNDKSSHETRIDILNKEFSRKHSLG